jgi:hypothetical protein
VELKLNADIGANRLWTANHSFLSHISFCTLRFDALAEQNDLT